MGLIGLASFLAIVVLFFRQVWLAWPKVQGDLPGSVPVQQPNTGLEAILLGLAASVVGILVGGIFDHYFFNLNFPHSVAIFWIYLGLAMAAVRLGSEVVVSPQEEGWSNVSGGSHWRQKPSSEA